MSNLRNTEEVNRQYTEMEITYKKMIAMQSAIISRMSDEMLEQIRREIKKQTE